VAANLLREIDPAQQPFGLGRCRCQDRDDGPGSIDGPRKRFSERFLASLSVEMDPDAPGFEAAPELVYDPRDTVVVSWIQEHH